MRQVFTVDIWFLLLKKKYTLCGNVRCHTYARTVFGFVFLSQWIMVYRNPVVFWQCLSVRNDNFNYTLIVLLCVWICVFQVMPINVNKVKYKYMDFEKYSKYLPWMSYTLWVWIKKNKFSTLYLLKPCKPSEIVVVFI